MTDQGLMIGVIADDFTGATDIAGFLVNNGLPTVQLNGEFLSSTELSHAVEQAINQGNQAVVVSLKSRSIPAAEAVEKSLNVLAVLRKFNVQQVYFKYCSTFDSTAQGNIGPVTDALLAELGESMTVVCPALPVNGRTIYNGYLFVDGVPLDESGMRDHPLTPMRDSSLTRLLEAQAQGKAGVVSVDVVDQGA
ncbi:MAG TPA: four-carbon acid sugar kinase family protein, partial [Beutenbergiaceae bacterium]|nr:four-carbon acid sugar kinase family protein [Beutenbergiaceae bacterium]